MSHRKCPQCGEPLDFQNMVLALNPFAIPCGGCAQKIRPHTGITAVIALILLLATYAGWTALQQHGMKPTYILVSVFGVFLGFEYLLYMALDKGLIPSNLIEADKPSAAKQLSAAVASQSAKESAKDSPAQGSTTAMSASPAELLPVIKTQAWREQLKQQIGEQYDSMPINQPLVGDLLLTFAIDRENDRIALSPASLRQFGLDQQLAMEAVATTASRNALQVLSTIRQGQRGEITVLGCDNHLMASALLYPELWDQLEQQAGDELVVAVPHRDEVWYVPAGNHQAVDALREAVDNFAAADNHGLSTLLFAREEGEWEVYNDR